MYLSRFFCYNPSRLTRYVPTARFSSFAAALISSNAFFGMLQYSIASPTFFRPAFWRLPPHVLFVMFYNFLYILMAIFAMYIKITAIIIAVPIIDVILFTLLVNILKVFDTLCFVVLRIKV